MLVRKKARAIRSKDYFPRFRAENGTAHFRWSLGGALVVDVVIAGGAKRKQLGDVGLVTCAPEWKKARLVRVRAHARETERNIIKPGALWLAAHK